MHHGLNFPHPGLGAQFSEDRQCPLKVFHATLFVGSDASKAGEQLTNLHSQVVGFCQDQGLTVVLNRFISL